MTWDHVIAPILIWAQVRCHLPEQIAPVNISGNSCTPTPVSPHPLFFLLAPPPPIPPPLHLIRALTNKFQSPLATWLTRHVCWLTDYQVLELIPLKVSQLWHVPVPKICYSHTSLTNCQPHTISVGSFFWCNNPHMGHCYGASASCVGGKLGDFSLQYDASS